VSSPFTIRPLGPNDAAWLKAYITNLWGAEITVVHGVVYKPAELGGFVAMRDDAYIGQITYNIEGTNCEIVTLNSELSGVGVGSALIAAVRDVAIQQACTRLWLITTNDNLNALKFYQKRGFRIVAVHSGAVDKARKLKSEIPLIGDDGIPLHDEIELAMPLK
jgi:GNAT superfamily N-acetyltransferase